MLKGRLALNASALMISSAATGLLGLVYWMVAERMLPTSEVGRASAMISAATVLSSLACLSLAGAYQRFLPVAGNRSLRLILSGYGLITGTSILLGTAFVTLGFGSSIFTSTTDRVLFVPLVLVLAIYAITDPILIGLRRSPAVAVKNVGLSVVKIVPLFFLSGTATAVAVTGSWMVLAALITVVFMLHAVRLALARRLESADELPGNRELMSFQSAFFTMMLITSVTPFALPLIVVETVGTTQNAYFNLAWTMTSAAGLVRSSVGSAFIVEAVQPGAKAKPPATPPIISSESFFAQKPATKGVAQSSDQKLASEGVAHSPDQSPLRTAYADGAWLASVHAFSCEGRYIPFRTPALFLVTDRGEPVWNADKTLSPERFGLPHLDRATEFAGDLSFWTFERGAQIVRLDMAAGTVQRLVVDVESSATQGRRIDLVGQESTFMGRLAPGN